ncbi:MAG: acid phosphatase AphA [Chlorobiaceae bacterium]|jgi:acid phosphatase (class B)|nr:acid phosphatase AphA [Chlorobiaceae bacterium]
MAGKFRIVIALISLFAVTACSRIHYVTVEKIRDSLPAQQVVAGFDIDDTVLFSSPGFYYGQFNQDGPGGSNKYGSSPLKSAVFWNDMNGQFDNFSIPKKSGRALIEMHKQRGDKIVFISARDSSKVNIVPKIITQCFGIQNPDVMLTSNPDKTSFIKARQVTIYYGDSDSDITAAQKVNARPIRVRRSHLSTNTYSYDKVGELGEEVLRDSEN